MGLFGDDERQDARLDALEGHIRTLTEALHSNQVDTATCRAAVLRLQAQVDQKISAEDVDPALAAFNDDLRAARKAVDESTQAASQSWAKLQEGVNEALESLRKSLNRASERLEQEAS